MTRTEALDRLHADGVRLLSYWRLADTEAEHVQALLALLDLPQNARVVDLGSGTGETARLARSVRPDLQWVLVNKDAGQLSMSPSEAVWVQADMLDSGQPAGLADAVIVAYAQGFVNQCALFLEANRLLKPRGQLLLHELYAKSPEGVGALQAWDGFVAPPFECVAALAPLCGLEVQQTVVDTFHAKGPTVAEGADVFNAQEHNVTVLRKTGEPVFGHKSAALQFSGGKDSMACLYLLQSAVQLGLPVYWVDNGDVVPETRAVVEAVRQWVPDFRVVRTDIREWMLTHGAPSDITTAQSSFYGQLYGMGPVRLSTRFDCTFETLMLPLHQRMVADRMQVVIRGTKLSDTGRVPAEGPTGFYDVALPIQDWSHEDVFAFLRKTGAPVSDIYQFFKGASAPESLHETSWWDDGKAAYLVARHPDVARVYRDHLRAVQAEVTLRMQDLQAELDVLEGGDDGQK